MLSTRLYDDLHGGPNLPTFRQASDPDLPFRYAPQSEVPAFDDSRFPTFRSIPTGGVSNEQELPLRHS